MKRIVTLLSGTALAAALVFGAQETPANSAPAKSSTTTALVTKKHVKKHKKAAKTTPTVAPATPATPAKK
jgi:hypothetical protein